MTRGRLAKGTRQKMGDNEMRNGLRNGLGFRRKTIGLLVALVSSCVLLAAWAAIASAAPAIESYTAWGDTNLTPGGQGQFALHLRNAGDENASGNLKIHEELPEGVTIEEVVWDFEETDIAKIALFVGWCKITDGRILDCNIPSPIVANFLRMQAPGDKGSLLAASPSGWSAPAR